jgi:uncharacterized protein (TIGR00251 family)
VRIKSLEDPLDCHVAENYFPRKKMAFKPVTLCIKVTPKASTTCLAGREGETLKIKLAAPPVDGRANDALVEFLAEQLKVPKKNISMRSGHKSRRKLVQVVGADPEMLKKFCLAAEQINP